MANPNNPHDKFFRSSMQNVAVSELFFQHFLPAQLSHHLNVKAMKLDSNSYIDETLRETISDLLRSFWHYMLLIGDPSDLDEIIGIIQNSQQLIEPIRGEFMNLAEQLEARGEARGEEKGREKEREKIAINLLKEGVDLPFIARISGLELAVVVKLKAQLDHDGALSTPAKPSAGPAQI